MQLQWFGKVHLALTSVHIYGPHTICLEEFKHLCVLPNMPSRKFALFDSYTCASSIALKFFSYGTVSDLFYSITIIFHLVATACPSLFSSRDLSESFTSLQQSIGQTICKKKKGSKLKVIIYRAKTAGYHSGYIYLHQPRAYSKV